MIGRRVRDVAEADALDAVAGYMTSNDVSARSVDFGFPRDTDDKAVWFFDWLAGKWLRRLRAARALAGHRRRGAATRRRCRSQLDVNGVTKQTGSTKDMIFSRGRAGRARVTADDPRTR